MAKQFAKNLIKYSFITAVGIGIISLVSPIQNALALNGAATYTVTYGNGQKAEINPGKIVSINAKEINSEGQFLQKWHIKDSKNNELDVITGKTVSGSGEDATAYLYFEMPDKDVTVEPEYGIYEAAVQDGLDDGKYSVYSTSDVDDLVMSYSTSISGGSYKPAISQEHSRTFTLTNAGDEYKVYFTKDDFSTPVSTRICKTGSSTVTDADISTGQMVVIDEPYIQQMDGNRPSFFDGYTIYASDKSTVLTPTMTSKKTIDTLDRETILVRTTFTMPGEDIYVVKNPPKKGYKVSLKYNGIAGSYLTSKADPTGSYYVPGEEVSVTMYGKTSKTPYYIYTTNESGEATDITLNRAVPNIATFTMPSYDLVINVKKISNVDKVKINSTGVIDMGAKKKGGDPYSVLIDTDDIYFNRLMIEKMEKATNGVYITVDDEGMIHMYQKDKSGNIINDCLIGKYNK